MKKIIGLSFLLPFIALAQTSAYSQSTGIGAILKILSGFISQLAPLLLALAFVWFLWNIVKYIEAGADPKGKDAARDSIIFTIILLFIMVSVWGLVGVLSNTFGLNNTAPKIVVPAGI